MFKIDGAIQLSASDLVGHLNCRYLTRLDLAVAHGKLAKPKRWDPLLDLLVQRGAVHEQAYVDHLKEIGHHVVIVTGEGIDASAVAQTAQLMKDGIAIIAQGAFENDGWVGR